MQFICKAVVVQKQCHLYHFNNLSWHRKVFWLLILYILVRLQGFTMTNVISVIVNIIFVIANYPERTIYNETTTSTVTTRKSSCVKMQEAYCPQQDRGTPLEGTWDQWLGYPKRDLGPLTRVPRVDRHTPVKCPNLVWRRIDIKSKGFAAFASLQSIQKNITWFPGVPYYLPCKHQLHPRGTCCSVRHCRWFRRLQSSSAHYVRPQRGLNVSNTLS